MHLHMSTILTLLITNVMALAAALKDPRQATGPVPTSTVPVPSKYQLQSKVIPGIFDCGTNKNDLFVFSYHTGAGLGVAALQKTPSDMWAYLNNTQNLFIYNDGPGPWPMTADHVHYRDFNEVSISIAGSNGNNGGYFFNETGLQLQGSNGWMACDLWYESPQLFVLNGLGRSLLPKSCSRVNLMPVAIET